MPVSKHEYVSSVWKDGLFSDKVVFCTGGNGSICSAQVRALVALGADACIVGRNVEKTKAVAKEIATVRAGSRVLGLGAVDVRSVEKLQRAVDTCVKELGGIDFLIAGAAGNFLAPLAQISPNGFKSIIDIDILGSYNVTKVALPHLLASARKHNSFSSLPQSLSSNTGPGGRIVYVSAITHYTGLPLQTHVATAKAGVDALSANVAIEYGPFGITSNTVAPGPIAATEGMDRLSTTHKAVNEDDATARLRVPKVPLQRMGSVKDIADATVFLFSDAANYITGENIVVDGGSWHMGGGSLFGDFKYPDFLLSEEKVTGVTGIKEKKTAKL